MARKTARPLSSTASTRIKTRRTVLHNRPRGRSALLSIHRCSSPSQVMSAAELLAEIEHETLQSVCYISLEAFATDLMLQFLNAVRCSGEAPFNKSKHNRD